MKKSALLISIILILACGVGLAQTTEFTYQGSLQNGGIAASGNYDFEFLLYDAVSGGSQLGLTLTQNNVAVSAGVFSVKLDFGSQFPGANRYLEIHVRPTGGGAFTPLTPRQQVNSTPYSVKSLNTDQLGGIAANQYVTATGGNASYIQNTTSQQTANFNINGTGTAGGTLSGNIINAATQYNIGGSRVLSVPGTNNFFAGVGAGQSNTGSQNSFVGRNAGLTNISGARNTTLGDTADVTLTNLVNATAIGANAQVRQSNSLVLGSIANVNGATADTNVGIGTTAPDQRLTVNGNGFFGDTLSIFTQSGNTPLVVKNFTSGGTVASFGRFGSFQVDSTTVTGGRFTILENGNIGIGTAAPNHKLHVVGENVRVEGNTSGIFPRFSLNFTGGGVDQKKWQNYASPNGLNFTALNDAENDETRWLRVNRGTGTAITSVVLPGEQVSIELPSGLILRSPNNACWAVNVSNAGTLSTTSVPCP